MSTLLRLLRDHRVLWRVWLPLVLLTCLLPLFATAMPLVERQLIDRVLLDRRLDGLLPAVLLYATLWLLHTAAGILVTGLGAYSNERLTLLLRQRLLAHCAALAVPFAHRGRVGRTMALFTNDAPVLGALTSTVVTTSLGSLVGLAVAGATMLTLNWQLALAAAVAPPVVGAFAGVVTRPLRPAARRAQEKAADLSERVQESLAGLREVVAFGREAAQAGRFGHTLHDLMRLRLRLTLLDTGLRTGHSLFSLAVSLVILGYGGLLVVRGETTIGTLVAMQTLFGLLLQPASQLFSTVAEVQKGLAAADRVYLFLDEAPEVTQRIGARTPATRPAAVTFERVGFAYGAEGPTLQGVSFTARAGETIALVGPSGAGKTTLIGLLPRFYDPSAGRILLDGTDVRDLTLDGLRSRIGFVFQDTFLFSASVRENIAFGHPEASDTEIVAAARAAHAWEFIERLPRGLDTPLGERGARLSAGQRQRLAIARALLRDPAILILDEPTAALDARAESLVQRALDEATHAGSGRITFVVAHRLATVQRADRILVLDGGRIVQQGSHAELCRRPGLYRDLCLLQLGAARADERLAGEDELEDAGRGSAAEATAPAAALLPLTA